MTKYKNWTLFDWALRHLKIDSKRNDIIYKKCLRNNILVKLMDLSGVKPEDVNCITYHKNMTVKEFERKGS